MNDSVHSQDSNRSNWLVAVAFLAAPLAVPFIITVVFGLGAAFGIRKFAFDSWADHIARSVSFALSIAVLGYAYLGVLVAIPAVVWLTVRNRASQQRIVVLGAAIGGLPFVFYFAYVLLAGGARELRAAPEGLIWLAAATGGGGAAATTFWWVARKPLERMQGRIP